MVIFDREENLQKMAEECPFPWFATHINSIESAASEYARLAEALDSPLLRQHAAEWACVAERPALDNVNWQQVPGQLKQLSPSQRAGQVSAAGYSRIEYIIWRSPWIAIGRETFISSVLKKLGFAAYVPDHDAPYPTLDEADMNRDDTFYLFSSEPYRFLRYQEQLEADGFAGAIVDGELYSWFGIRSLRGLQSLLPET
jgi:hypothetical protein